MPWLIEAYNQSNEEIMEESGTLHKALIGAKVNRGNSKEKIFKQDHGNKNLLNYVQKCNSIEDLEYIRRDTYTGIKAMEKTYQSLKAI